jgi:hypothetical protein
VIAAVLSFLLSSVHAAVQSVLDQFFANLRNRADSDREVTAQAFYQARYKINALVFGEVNQHLMGLVQEPLPIPRWRGLRVVPADGSAVRLTMMKDLVRSIVTRLSSRSSSLTVCSLSRSVSDPIEATTSLAQRERQPATGGGRYSMCPRGGLTPVPQACILECKMPRIRCCTHGAAAE